MKEKDIRTRMQSINRRKDQAERELKKAQALHDQKMGKLIMEQEAVQKKCKHHTANAEGDCVLCEKKSVGQPCF